MSFIDDIKLRTKILIPQVAVAAIFAGLLAINIGPLTARRGAMTRLAKRANSPA